MNIEFNYKGLTIIKSKFELHIDNIIRATIAKHEISVTKGIDFNDITIKLTDVKTVEETQFGQLCLN